jgi:hypothetical protein
MAMMPASRDRQRHQRRCLYKQQQQVVVLLLQQLPPALGSGPQSMQRKRQQQMRLAVKLALLLLVLLRVLCVLRTAVARVMQLCSQHLLLSRSLLTLSSCKLPKSCHSRKTAAAASATVRMRHAQVLLQQCWVPQHQPQQQAQVWQAVQIPLLKTVQLSTLHQLTTLMMMQQGSAAVALHLLCRQSQMLMQQQ